MNFSRVICAATAAAEAALFYRNMGKPGSEWILALAIFFALSALSPRKDG